MTRRDEEAYWAYSTEEQRSPRGMHRRSNAAGLLPRAPRAGREAGHEVRVPLAIPADPLSARRRQLLSTCAAIVAVLATLFVVAAAQQPERIRVEVRAGGEAVAGAEVVVEGASRVTDAAGVALVPAPAGAAQVTVVQEGFVSVTMTVPAGGGAQRVVRIELQPELTIEEEVTVVASTRTGRRIEDQPLRVEALEREEIEEKMLMTPGDIVMMLNEMGGMRVQSTSPSLGAASVRIQGMRGRYTRLLSDGLPLYGSQPGGLGLLQIPPMDLGQVEVIKGVASALHGAGAMGGVVNLLSRRPGDELERSAAATGRPSRTSTATAGRTCPTTAAASSARGCSGKTARVDRCSSRPGRPARRAPAARRRAARSRPQGQPTGKPSTPAATTSAPCGRHWPGARS